MEKSVLFDVPYDLLLKCIFMDLNLDKLTSERKRINIGPKITTKKKYSYDSSNELNGMKRLKIVADVTYNLILKIVYLQPHCI